MKNGLFSLGLVIKSNHNFEKTQWLVATSLTLGNFIKIDSTLVTHQKSTFFHSTQALKPTHTCLCMPLGHTSVTVMGGRPPWGIDISLAFKSGNLIKVLVPSSKVPFASPSKVGLPSPRFNTWWFGIKKRVKNFGENGSQHVDIPPISQGDLTLKLFAKAKPSTVKRKGKNIKVPTMKKPRVCTLLPWLLFCNNFLINGVCQFLSFFLPFDHWQVKETAPQTQAKAKATPLAHDTLI